MMKNDPFLSQAEELYDMFDIESALTIVASNIEKDLLAFSLNNQDAGIPLVIGVMNGALMTMGCLLPKLNHLVEMDYCHATRYGNKTSGGEMAWLAKPKQTLNGRYVILVDDIFDEGVTLKQISNFCYAQGAAVVKTAVLLDKKHQRKVANFTVDYTGLEIDDRYVFGFGLDYKGLYRNAPGIFALTHQQLSDH